MSLQYVNLLMRRRSSKNAEDKQLILQHHQPRNIYSPIKSPFLREITYSNFKRERPLLELPKILLIHNTLKHKRNNYPHSIQDDPSLNLIGLKMNKKLSKQKKSSYEQLIEIVQVKKQRPFLQRQQTIKNIFLNNMLYQHGIGKVIFNKKDKIKVFIDEGNNSRLINELIRRRSSLKIIDDKTQANFVWTQFCDWESANQGSAFTQTETYPREMSTITSEFNQNQHLNCKTEAAEQIIKRKNIVFQQLKMHNHLKYHSEISDKKSLFKNIRKYCKAEKIDQREIIPKTYHLDGNSILPEEVGKNNSLWIIKPGEDTNRGTGISVKIGTQNILESVRQLSKKGKTAIVQEYIDPLLYKNRKFDLRCYVLVTSYAGDLKAYWYKQGYLRTCSKQFSYDIDNFFGHITNDAVQKKHKDYGKYEQCNKLSFSDLEYLFKSKDLNYHEAINRMKQLAYISIKSAEDRLKGQKSTFAFEIFGYDFLIDSKGKVWLIQINTNPCLQFSGSLLSRIIWHMVQNSLAIALDPLLMQIPESYSSAKDKLDKIYQQSKFQCII